MTQSTRKITAEFDNGLTLSKLLHKRVTAVKSMTETPNTAVLEVFWVSAETFTKLKEQPNVKIMLNDELFYSGKVINVTNVYNGTDWLCTLYCNDVTLKPYAQKQYLTIPKGTTKTEAIKKISSTISPKIPMNLEDFKKCKKSNSSLAKEFKVAYKKEQDILKAVNSMFKDCGSIMIKEDGQLKVLSRNVGSKKTVTGSKLVTKKATVPNISNPIIFSNLFDPPRISSDEIAIVTTPTSEPKLGLGFKVFAKSYQQQLQKPFVLEETFKDRIYRVIEVVHTVDNYSTEVSTTQIKGEYVK